MGGPGIGRSLRRAPGDCQSQRRDRGVKSPVCDPGRRPRRDAPGVRGNDAGDRDQAPPARRGGRPEGRARAGARTSLERARHGAWRARSGAGGRRNARPTARPPGKRASVGRRRDRELGDVTGLCAGQPDRDRRRAQPRARGARAHRGALGRAGDAPFRTPGLASRTPGSDLRACRVQYRHPRNHARTHRPRNSAPDRKIAGGPHRHGRTPLWLRCAPSHRRPRPRARL